MPGYGEDTYGSGTYGDLFDSPPDPDGWPAEPPHGVGPPRFGIRPRVGLHPGHDPAYDVTPPRRTIHYPGTTEDEYPGRGLFIFIDIRRAIYPATDLFPGTGLFSGGSRARTAVTLLSAAGRFLHSAVVGRVRSSTLEGSGRLSDIPLVSSDLPTTMSQVVTLASNSERVELAASGERIQLSSGAQVVSL